MKHLRTRRVVARAVAIGAAVALLVGMAGAVEASASTLGGTATIADPANSLAPLASGGSAKLFSVTLPAQAACTGDSANQGYRVYSFLVQQGTDPSTLTFSGGQPSAGYGFFDSTGTYYGSALTAINTGQIIGIPNNFQWSQLTASSGLGLSLTGANGLLYSGTSGVWEAGILCTDTNGHVSDYWNTEVTFTASGSDPNGFVWAAVPGVPSGAPEVPMAILLPIIGILVAGGGIGFSRLRRRGRTATVPVAHR